MSSGTSFLIVAEKVIALKNEFTILIADRNPRVRDFLKRELNTEGYQVNLARSLKEVLEKVYHGDSIDLLILDLDLPDTDGYGLIESISSRIPELPIVVHTYLSDFHIIPKTLSSAVFVETTSAHRCPNLIFQAFVQATGGVYAHRAGKRPWNTTWPLAWYYVPPIKKPLKS